MGDVWYMILSKGCIMCVREKPWVSTDKTRGKPNRASGSEAIRRSFTHQCEAPTGTEVGTNFFVGEEWAVEEMEPANM